MVWRVSSSASSRNPHAFARAFNAQYCNKIGLPGAFIPAQRLSDNVLITFSIEQVIGNLVGQSEVLGKSGERVAGIFARL